MNKTGLVMKIEKNSAAIMTTSGEFFKVAVFSKIPKIGEEYTGKLKKENSLIKVLITAACLLFMALSGGGVYDYYTPTSSVVININPSIKLETNRWIKIIKCSALNKDGETILKEISIKNKSLNEGLNLIVEQSKKDNFINEKYIKDSRVISIKLSGKNNKILDLSKFQEYIIKNNLNLEINSNGKKTNFNREIDKGNSDVKARDSENNKSNKESDSPLIKKTETKDIEIKNTQNNYDNNGENKPSVKDTEKKGNTTELEKDKHNEKANENKNK